MRKALPWIGAVAATVLFVALIAWWVHSDNVSAAKDRRDQAAQLDRANRICGDVKPRDQMHGSGWSWGPWIEVHCSDGTVRAIHD